MDTIALANIMAAGARIEGGKDSQSRGHIKDTHSVFGCKSMYFGAAFRHWCAHFKLEPME